MKKCIPKMLMSLWYYPLFFSFSLWFDLLCTHILFRLTTFILWWIYKLVMKSTTSKFSWFIYLIWPRNFFYLPISYQMMPFLSSIFIHFCSWIFITHLNLALYHIPDIGTYLDKSPNGFKVPMLHTYLYPLFYILCIWFGEHQQCSFSTVLVVVSWRNSKKKNI